MGEHKVPAHFTEIMHKFYITGEWYSEYMLTREEWIAVVAARLSG